MTICVLPGEHVGLCGRFPVVVITWCSGWRDVISIMTSLSYGCNSVFCGLTWGHISGAKIGRYRLLLSQNAVYTHFIPSPRPRFWDVVSRQLIEQRSSHRGHRWLVFQVLKVMIQCKPNISRLVGSMERYRDISGSAIYRAAAMSQNPGQVFQRVVSGHGAFVCLAANSARRQRISWHLSKFDVLQNRVVEFHTKAVCA